MGGRGKGRDGKKEVEIVNEWETGGRERDRESGLKGKPREGEK